MGAEFSRHGERDVAVEGKAGFHAQQLRWRRDRRVDVQTQPEVHVLRLWSLPPAPNCSPDTRNPPSRISPTLCPLNPPSPSNHVFKVRDFQVRRRRPQPRGLN